MYIQIMTVTTDKPTSDKTPTHLESEMETLPEAVGHSAEQSQPPEKLHRTTMEKTEEKSSILVRQHFILDKTRYLLRHVSLSFIVQGGRPLESLTSSLFSILSDRDTP